MPRSRQAHFIDTADAYGNFGAPRGSGPASLTDGVSRTPRTFRPKDPGPSATPPLPWGQFSSKAMRSSPTAT